MNAPRRCNEHASDYMLPLCDVCAAKRSGGPGCLGVFAIVASLWAALFAISYTLDSVRRIEQRLGLQPLPGSVLGPER